MANKLVTPSIILKQLQANIPRHTDMFSSFVTVTSASVSGVTVTVAAPSHGLTNGTFVNIVSGTTRNQIVSYSINPVTNTAEIVLSYQHDFTQSYHTTVVISGTGSEWDGAHDLVAVKSSTVIVVNAPSLTPPTVNGYAIEDRPNGVVGMAKVASVVDADTFTVDLDCAPYGNTEIDNIAIVKAVRIACAADVDRAEAIYSRDIEPKSKPAMFVFMDTVSTSKDRYTFTDATVESARGTALRITRIINFQVAVFIPTKNDLSGAYAQQLAYGELDDAIILSMYGALRESGESRAVPVVHRPGIYNTAYYSHVWTFELTQKLDFTNAFNRDHGIAVSGDDFVGEQSAAVRSAQLGLLPFNDPEAVVWLEMDLP